MREEWIKIMLQIMDSPNNVHEIKCPSCKKAGIDYLYIGDKKTRAGYVQIWCNECLKGIYISRVIAPVNTKFVSFDEDIKNIVPQYEFIEE